MKEQLLFISICAVIGGMLAPEVHSQAIAPGDSFSDVSSEAGASSVVDITDECVKAHNIYRSKDVTPALQTVTASPRAAAHAVEFMKLRESQNCALFEHSKTRERLGENLYGATHVKTCHLAVGAWYQEIKDYDPKKSFRENFQAGTGHFTQVMWHSSIGIGCAKTTTCRMNQIVCNYDPPGNWATGVPFTEEQWKSIQVRDLGLLAKADESANTTTKLASSTGRLYSIPIGLTAALLLLSSTLQVLLW